MTQEVMDYTKRFPEDELPGNNQALHVYSCSSIGLTRPLFKDYLLKFVINLGIKPKNHLHIDSETFRVLDDLERYKNIVIFQIIQSAIWRNIDPKANTDSISTSLSTTLWILQGILVQDQVLNKPPSLPS